MENWSSGVMEECKTGLKPISPILQCSNDKYMFSALRTTIYLLAVLIGLSVISPAFALEISSKRDCVVCHVMWMDDFRTDKETLIEWQPGNVLMKDTQGVVSSEEICYSCHDGYVNDSRYVLGKYNRHKTFVRPSKNVFIPAELPLSVKNEIYCGTCHSAHGKGAAPHGNPLGLTSVFREDTTDSNLCEMCHRNEASYKSSNSHPVHSTALELPNVLFELGSKKAQDRNRVICQTCHKVHGAKGDKILIIDNSNSELCIICHEKQRSLIDTKHDLRLTLPDEKNIKEQLLSKSGPCSACHTPHNAPGRRLWARSIKSGNPASQMCLTCHGEDTGYKTKRIGAFSHPINVAPTANEAIPEHLPLFSEDGSKNTAGLVQCFTCHDVHKWDPNSATNKGGKDVEGDSSNSFLRMSNSLSSTLCLECHVDKKQLITSDHNLEITAPEEKNIQGFNAKVSGPCGACHVPHNAAANHIWSKNPSGDKDFVTQLCTACHNEKGIAKSKLIGNNYHPVDVTLEKLNIAAILPMYDSDGNKKTDGKVVCITCHEPHIWDPAKTGPLPDYESKNIEGDASTSFLRKANYPFSELCKTCHTDQALVDGTDHDLTVTAPKAINLLGQIAKESGQCGVCHLVHNSPNKLKLWARQYGTISPEEGIMDALCTSCHSKGNAGERKIPPIATHPKDRLINNIMRSNKSDIDYAPLYDKNGKEITVGNISCPSCHNAHQWSPVVKQKGNGKNIEGNATNSFLRNVSYNNICIDCHGLDALFRYKYFHNPAERIEIIRPLRPENIK
jgi:predicted CXXCH cytochrome family protein